MVSLATAHPAKFPEAVEAATGRAPDLPEGFADLMSGKETFAVLANDQRRSRTIIARPCRRGEE